MHGVSPCIEVANYANELNLQAQILQDLGQFSKAEQSIEKGLSRISTFEGKNNIYYCNLLITLGCVSGRAGNFQKALENHIEALDIAFVLFGENNVLTADCFYFISKDYIYFGNEKWTEILNYSQKSLRIYKKLLGENHPRVYQVLTLIALSHRNLKDYETSLREFEDLKDMVEKTMGEKTQMYLNIMTNFWTSLYRFF